MRWTWICLAIVGCGDSAPPIVDTELVFEPESPATDSAVYLTGELLDDALSIDVWLRSSEVFGVSAHVVHALEPIDVVGDAPLGTDDEARHLVVEEPGDVAVGGTRLAGEISADEPLHLATLRFGRPTAPSDLRVDAVTVRRADGSFVPTSAFGAAVIEREVE